VGRSSPSTGVDSGRSWRFSTGAGTGPGVDIFDWTGARAGAGVIFNHTVFEILMFICILRGFVTGVKQEQESIIFL